MKLSRIILSTLTAAALTAGIFGFAVAPAANAAAGRNGVCETGEFCLYWAPNQTGSVSDFAVGSGTGSIADLGKHTFVGPGNGKGQVVRNNAYSVWNNSSQPVTVYANSSYAGVSQTINPGQKTNLSSVLVNKEASFKVAIRLTATLSVTKPSARAQIVTVTVPSCPSGVTLTYPWWAMPAGVNGQAPKSKSFSCSGSTSIRLQLITNTTGSDRTAPITVTSAGQKVTLPLTQTKAVTSSTLRYVALGDSYSAGAGTSATSALSSVVPTWIKSTTSGYDKPNAKANTGKWVLPSKRNAGAWPALLAYQSKLALIDFRASSGAKTDQVIAAPSAKLDGGNQADRVTMAQIAGFSATTAKSVDVVTITIGGNDVDFVGFVSKCVVSGCDKKAADRVATDITLRDKLTATYKRILSTFPQATVYVVGYPLASPPNNVQCVPTAIAMGGLNDPNWAKITTFTNNLNAQILRAVNAMNDPRLRFVSITQSDFPGYLCKPSGSMFVPITIKAAGSALLGALGEPATMRDESFGHQNAAGQQAYATAVQKALAGTKTDLYGR